MNRTTPILAAALVLAGASLASAAPGWTDPTPVAAAGGGVNGTSVAFDGQGLPIVAWMGTGDFTAVARSSAKGPAGTGWGAVQSVPGSEDWRQGAPRIVVDRAGDAVMTWLLGAMQGNIVFASERPAGGTWTQAAQLSASPWPGGAGLAMDPDGKAIIVWPESFAYDQPPTAALAGLVRPAGAGWSPRTTLDALTAGAGEYVHIDSADVALDPAGRAVAVWSRTKKGSTTIQSAYRPAGGSWSPPHLVAPATGAAGAIGVRLDASGTATATWLDDGDVLASRSAWASDSWEPAATLSGPAGGANSDLDLAVDPGGKAIVVWTANDAVSAAVHPVGGSWSSRTTISASGALLPVVALDAGGNAIAAWMRSIGGSSIVEASLRPQGGDWTSPRTLNAAGHFASSPSVAFSPTGDGLVAWGDGGAPAYAAWDTTPPSLSGVRVPSRATAGTPLTVSMDAPTDMWSAVPGVGWDFGDGATAGGTSASHAWSAPGVYTVTARAQDALGNVATQARQVAVTAPAPVITFDPSGPPGTTGSVGGVVVVALPGAGAGSTPKPPASGSARHRRAVTLRIAVPALTAGRKAVIGVRLSRAVRGALVRVQLRRGVRYRTIAQGRVTGRRIPVALAFAAPGRYLIRIQLREAGARPVARVVPVRVRG